MDEEKQSSKSPAEFFAEHQAIAGYDNHGKALYTTIRELVENGLDACESVGVLPSISVELVEYTQAEFNRIYVHRSRKQPPSSPPSKPKSKSSNDVPQSNPAAGTQANSGSSKRTKKAKEDAYFKLSVTDNGCGMKHSAIPNLLGRVLSGSKHGVRQTRGKFGLGAKMALIWAKKSSGQPIRVVTGHRRSASAIPTHVSECVLDIDVSKNEPTILEHTQRQSSNRGDEKTWVGTKVEVVIAGNWTTYRSRVLAYLQQLAIITPYADLDLAYHKHSEQSIPKKHLKVTYDRRSEQMPPPAKPTLHHPSGLNNIILQQLIQSTKAKTLSKFLLTELCGLSPGVVRNVLSKLGFKNEKPSGRNRHRSSEDDDDDDDDDSGGSDLAPHHLTPSQITRLVQVLRSVSCKAPDTSVLSPLGEYNLNLGITKVLEPDLVATCRDRPGNFEGHGFVVEAAVSLGGKSDLVKEGVQVYRFANRIPLLFEGGADVATRVALTNIKWAQYKIDPRLHRIGVFVSVVSTKIPFKGTSKEYIGDDAVELRHSVKRALQGCCQQLRVHLLKRQSLKSALERQSKLNKYIPDVSRSLYGMLDAMRKRRSDELGSSDATSLSSRKRQRTGGNEVGEDATDSLLRKLGQHVTTETFATCLRASVQDEMDKVENEADETVAVSVYLVPLYNLDDPKHDVVGPLFRFRPIVPMAALSQL
jgi:DNA topoisomerase VI subunit B